MVMEAIDSNEKIITYEDGEATSMDRALATHLVGALTRHYGFANGMTLGSANGFHHGGSHWDVLLVAGLPLAYTGRSSR